MCSSTTRCATSSLTSTKSGGCDDVTLDRSWLGYRMGSLTTGVDRSSRPVFVSGDTGGEGNWVKVFGKSCLTGEAIVVAGVECEKLSYGVGSGGDMRVPMGTLWGRFSISRIRLKSKGLGRMGGDVNVEAEINPTIDFVEDVGKDAASKLVEGSSRSLSAM